MRNAGRRANAYAIRKPATANVESDQTARANVARRAPGIPNVVKDPIRAWWTEPVEGWPDWLTVRNLLTGRVTTIPLRQHEEPNDDGE
jgi:hypothetical protein